MSDTSGTPLDFSQMNRVGNTDPGDKSSARIECEVEGTRARLAQNLEALRESVSPNHPMDQAMEYVRGSGGTEFVQNLSQAVRDNPLPVLLIGAGVGWLLLSGGKSSRSGRAEPRQALPAPAISHRTVTEGGVTWVVEVDGGDGFSRIERADTVASGIGERVGDAASRGKMTEQPRAGNRHPDPPAEGPPRAWWGILRRTAGSVVRHHLADEAGGVAFFALLALVPALTALVSLYGLFADPAAVAEHLDALAAVAPDRGARVVGDYARRLAADGRGALGLGAVGGAAALWSMNRAVRVLVRGMNRVYGGREAGGFLARTARTLALTLGGVLFALLAVGAVVVLPFALRFLGLGGAVDILLRFLRWPLLLAAATVFLACLYRYGPCRAEPRWRWVSWGAPLPRSPGCSARPPCPGTSETSGEAAKPTGRSGR